MKIVLLSLLLALFTGCYGQKLYIGPELGVNIIQINQTDLGKDFQPGFYGGLVGEYRFNSWFSLKSGVNYSQKRQAFQELNTVPSILLQFIDSEDFEQFDLNTYQEIKGRVTQHFIEIPILANFSWKNFNFFTGGYAAFMVSANTKEIDERTTPFLQVIDVSSIDDLGALAFLIPPAYEESTTFSSSKSGLRSFDYGIKAGIGYEFTNLRLDGTYQFGIPDYRTANNGELIRHQFFQFSLAYLFGIKR